MKRPNRREFIAGVAAGLSVAGAANGDPHGDGISDQIPHLALQQAGYTHTAAIPYLLNATEPVATLLRLSNKQLQLLPGLQSYTKLFTINGITTPAAVFLFGSTPPPLLANFVPNVQQALQTNGQKLFEDMLQQELFIPPGIPLPPTAPPANAIPLDSPDQFSIAFPSIGGLDQAAAPLIAASAAALTDPAQATGQFWPTLANFSLPHNLLILEKVRHRQAKKARKLFGTAWSDLGMESLSRQGLLYAIDMTIFDVLDPAPANPLNRFTHATYTVLKQDPQTKTIEPIAIHVSGKSFDGKGRVYANGKAAPGAWMYALQAAKASILAHAIWCRHVYIWHIVPSAVQMTMFNNLTPHHPVYQMLAPQSNYTIGFNEVMLLLFPFVAPPTSLFTQRQFLTLINEFAKGREFFDDDPKEELENLGLRQEDFTFAAPWDRYSVVSEMLELWDATVTYVDTCVDAMYTHDSAVARDHALQRWMAASASAAKGNLKGIRPLASRQDLKRLLSSILFRVINHGAANIVAPFLLDHLFVSNYPVCLQRNDIPDPNTNLDTKTLLSYLPNTDTIGTLAAFYFSFALAQPYEPFVPPSGPDTNLFFPGGLSDARNQALVAYRKRVAQFIQARAIAPNQVAQWPNNIET